MFSNFCFSRFSTFEIFLVFAVFAERSLEIPLNPCPVEGLRKLPCLVTYPECNYAVVPKPGSFILDPYPVCLPKGQCASDQSLRKPNGALYTQQNLVLQINNVQEFNLKRISVRSTMEIGRIGDPDPKTFPKCITNHFLSGNNSAPLEYAYGTCQLDTASPDRPSNLCDLFATNRVKTRDELGHEQIVRCNSNGLLYFTPESTCADASKNSCSIQLEFSNDYLEEGPLIYYPFRDREITLQLELFQMPTQQGDDSYKTQRENRACRQFDGYPKCLGYFYLKFITSA